MKTPSGKVPLVMSFAEALNAIQKLYKKGGKSLSKAQLAAELGYSPSSSGYFMRLSCMRQHGLIEDSGSSIELTSLGLKIVAPTGGPVGISHAKKEAMLRIPIYSALFTRYSNKDLPSKEDIANLLLHEKDLPKETAAVWATRFLDSVKACNLVEERNGRTLLLEEAYANPNQIEQIRHEAPPHYAAGVPAPTAPSMNEVRLPFGEGRYASFSPDLKPEELDKLIGILEVYRGKGKDRGK